MIKHYVILRDKEYRYICNQACGTTKEKCAKKSEDVTCKNCLQIIETGGNKDGL